MSSFLVHRRTRSESFYSGTFEVDDPATTTVDELAEHAVRELEQADFAAAERLLRRGLEQAPDHPRCLAYLAVCTAALGRGSDAAEELARQVIRDHPDDPSGWFALGQVHLLGGNRGAAFQHFARAREVAGRDRRFKARVDRQDPRNNLVFSALPRDHVLNVLAGRLRHLLRRG